MHYCFIITIPEVLHCQINCRHTIGMSTCPQCNEVQPCNLSIKCSLCPFIAWRELKASRCFALRSPVFQGAGGGGGYCGAAGKLSLTPVWQRQDRTSRVQLRNKPSLQAIFINSHCFNRNCVASQSNKLCESSSRQALSFNAFCGSIWWNCCTENKDDKPVSRSMPHTADWDTTWSQYKIQ